MANVITISALNRYVKSLLDSDTGLSNIAIKGEISNFVHHYKSGHYYFSLRDEKASVKAVMFRQDAQRLAFMPEDGMRVIVRCRVSLYEATGSFQVYALDIFPDGLGAAQMAFEQLKARLEKEGLFRQEYKKPIPQCPQCIGVVTSATGAALQDIRNILQRRWPLVKLLLAPVNVQGTQAAAQIAKGIQLLDASKRVDVIIVARGGGSREDLWVFNDEGIARAAFACKTPLISAVGHEIDFTILDFVADLRAPTPSAAAELATPDRALLLKEIMNISVNIHKNMQSRFKLCYNDFNELKLQRDGISPTMLCDSRKVQLEKLKAKRLEIGTQSMQKIATRLQHEVALAHSLSPYEVLSRGYSMIKDVKGNSITVENLVPDDIVLIQGRSATATCKVEKTEHFQGVCDEKA